MQFVTFSTPDFIVEGSSTWWTEKVTVLSRGHGFLPGTSWTLSSFGTSPSNTWISPLGEEGGCYTPNDGQSGQTRSLRWLMTVVAWSPLGHRSSCPPDPLHLGTFISSHQVGMLGPVPWGAISFLFTHTPGQSAWHYLGLSSTPVL